MSRKARGGVSGWCAGRGWGKTRVGAEWVRKQVETRQAARIALVGATAADVRDVMVEGPSGYPCLVGEPSLVALSRRILLVLQDL